MEGQVVIWLLWFPAKKGAMGINTYLISIYRFAIQCIAEIAVHWACSERKYQAWVSMYIYYVSKHGLLKQLWRCSASWHLNRKLSLLVLKGLSNYEFSHNE